MKDSSVDLWIANPIRVVQASILTLAVLWTVVPALLHAAPTGDIAEGYMWAREHVIGTYKHPGLPAWLLEASWILTGGAIGWPAYAMGQMCVAITLWLVFLIGRALFDEARGAAVALSLVGFEFMSWRSFDFNHNMMQMPLWIAVIWSAWHAVSTGGTWRWVLLGVVSAVGLYAKLSQLALLTVVAAWILIEPRGRRQLLSPGPWIGAIVFSVVATPLVLWLREVAYLPLEFAHIRAVAADRNFLGFVTTVMLTLLPTLIMLALAGLFQRGAEPRADHAGKAAAPGAMTFLWLMTLGPALLMIAVVLVQGLGFRPSWLSAALLPVPLLVVGAFSASVTPHHLRNLTVLTPWFIGIPIVGYIVVSLLPPLRKDGGLRTNWPAREIGAALAAEWSAATGGKPLRIVTGSSTWTVALAALHNPDRPSMFSPTDYRYAPWITPERLTRDGALLVWEANKPQYLSDEIVKRAKGLPEHTLVLPPLSRRAGDVTPEIRFIIIPPSAKPKS